MEKVTGRALAVHCDGKEKSDDTIATRAHEHALELLQAIPQIRERIASDVQAALVATRRLAATRRSS